MFETKIDEGPVRTWWSTYLGYNAHLVYFDYGTQKNLFFFFVFFFLIETNQIFIVCSDFISDAKHDHYDLKCDLVLKYLFMCF